jgi:hypothetical protein
MAVKSFITLTPGTNVIRLFCPSYTNFRDKLECLSLASIASLLCVGDLVRPVAYEHLKGAS